MNNFQGDSIESFAESMTAQCDTHKQWVSVMKYGMGTLLTKQALLLELIDREAHREVRRGSNEGHLIFVRIFNELGIKLTT